MGKAPRTRDKIVEIDENGKRVFAYNNKGQPICYCLRKGKRCQSTATMQNGRCKIHGGRAPKGIAHYNYRGLRVADLYPAHLRQDARAAENDPDPLSLIPEIRSADIQINQLRQQLGQGGLDKAAWKKAKALADMLENSMQTDPDWERSSLIAEDLINTIRTGASDIAINKEIREIEAHRMKLVATAHIRERDNKMSLKQDQAATLVKILAGAVKENVGKLLELIEKKYTLIDKDTGKPIARLDPLIKTSFLQDVAVRIGKVMGQLQPERVPTVKAIPENANQDAIDAEYEDE